MSYSVQLPSGDYSMSIVIRKPVATDRERWGTLFEGYQRFYRANVPEDIVEKTWNKMLSPEGDVHGLVADRGGELIGLTHYLYHPSTWSDVPSCYLEDLFVDRAARGCGAARMLIEGVEAAARERGAFRLYWHTQQYNSAARSLYDTVATPSSFMVYRKALT